MGSEAQTVRVGDRTLDWQEGESLLECLERQGVGVPSSCRSGVCHSCLVKATAGTPPQSAQLGLKETWKQQGLFLACVCTDLRPLTVALPESALSTRAVLTEKRHLSPDVVRLRFKLDQTIPYRAGQFISITRADGLTRSYSIASLPSDSLLELHVRRVEQGRMSTWLYDEAQEGAEVHLRGPHGDCFYLDGKPHQPLLLVATGTGLAPLIGIARDAIQQGHRGPILLMHGGRVQADLYLHDELTSLAQQHPQLRYLFCLSGDSETLEGHYKGRVTTLLDERHRELTGYRVFVCGSPQMVKDVKQHAYRYGAALEDLLADSFVPAKVSNPTQAPALAAPKRKIALPLLNTPLITSPQAASAAAPTPRLQKLRFAIQALTLTGFITQGALYYNANFKPLGGLLPFMAYDSLGHMMVSSALIVWALLFLLVLVFGRFVCGWMCPLGFMQDAGQKLLALFKIKLPPPRPQARVVRAIMVALILGHFIVMPLLAAPLHIWQLDLHYKEPWLLGFPFRSSLFVLDLLLVFVVIGIVLPLFMGPRPYCKLVCETGYLLDLTSRWSFGRIRRNTGFDRDTCLSCRKCSNICPQGIKVDEEVHLFDRVVNSNCITCLQCVSTCPNNTIVYSLKKRVLDTGRAAGYLATLFGQVTDLPRSAITGLLAIAGAYFGFKVLPPSYFHTYVLFASLGGLLGHLMWSAVSGLFGDRIHKDITAQAETQVQRELRERILPLSLEERRDASTDKRRPYARIALLAGLLMVVLASAALVTAAIPPRILDVDELATTTINARELANKLYLGVPQVHSSDRTHRTYLGLPNYLSRHMNRDVQLVSGESYGRLAWGLQTGRLDAALLPAGSALPLLARSEGSLRMAGQVVHAGSRSYRAVLVTAPNGPKTLQDVAGKRVAFVSLDSLSGYGAPVALLAQHDVSLRALGSVVMAGNHERALALLAANRVDVAATFDSAFQQYQQAHPESPLRELAGVGDLPNDVLIVATQQAPARSKALLQTLRALFKDEHANELRDRLEQAGISNIVPTSTIEPTSFQLDLH